MRRAHHFNLGTMVGTLVRRALARPVGFAHPTATECGRDGRDRRDYEGMKVVAWMERSAIRVAAIIELRCRSPDFASLHPGYEPRTRDALLRRYRHCEEHLRRSNPVLLRHSGLLRFARNDGGGAAPTPPTPAPPSPPRCPETPSLPARAPRHRDGRAARP
jgi:hypothetical protein